MTKPAVAKTPKLYLGGAFIRSESARVYQPDGLVNVPRASRKDLREAVRAARQAQPAWAGRTSYNRGQVLYRIAEMLDSGRSQFADALGGGRAAGRELDGCVDSLVFFAGAADKLAQLGGSVNSVAGPYFNFTIPEPAGVVVLIAPAQPRLLPLVTSMAAATCGGNAVVAMVSEPQPLPGLLLGEALQTGDLPPGVVALLSGRRAELLPWVGSHRDVDLVDAGGCTQEEWTVLARSAADSVMRVAPPGPAPAAKGPALALGYMELKTVWHPIGI